ncbi:mechanosensitive ion channel domain-containing protein [Haloplanus pelagicus]|jgi:small-conductance mechanosensitive channel|uniref:mechanosensitive ion channel domain-containing protein n=1 Tax=Haloplanus pelagicus TaxID=2949995 RepID=UPI00203F1BDC|nr:mechanosensitive ion channel domain-containing protein [Haloplanus sp. HW8-1]
MQVGTVREALTAVPLRFWLAVATLALGLVLGWVTRVISRRLLRRAGVPGAIEGTTFERTAREFGTSTVAILGAIAGYFVFGIAVFAAVAVAEIEYVAQFWNAVAGFLPQLFFAIIVLIVGVVLGDKVELLVSERFRGVKLPQINVLPVVAKYSVFYLAALIALGQVGVATAALIVLLAAYVFALVFLGGLACRQLLSAGAIGAYLLLHQPYTIGDEIRVGEIRGIVQEMDLFVTHIEAEDKEYVLPNNTVFADGFALVRS